MTEYVNTWAATNQDSGTPTLSGNSDLTWVGSLSQLGNTAANIASAFKKPAPATTSITTGKTLGGISTKTLLYIGGGIVALVVLLFLVKRK